MSTEKEKLQKELEFLSNLLAKHKQSQNVNCNGSRAERKTSDPLQRLTTDFKNSVGYHSGKLPSEANSASELATEQLLSSVPNIVGRNILDGFERKSSATNSQFVVENHTTGDERYSNTKTHKMSIFPAASSSGLNDVERQEVLVVENQRHIIKPKISRDSGKCILPSNQLEGGLRIIVNVSGSLYDKQNCTVLNEVEDNTLVVCEPCSDASFSRVLRTVAHTGNSKTTEVTQARQVQLNSFTNTPLKEPNDIYVSMSKYWQTYTSEAECLAVEENNKVDHLRSVKIIPSQTAVSLFENKPTAPRSHTSQSNRTVNPFTFRDEPPVSSSSSSQHKPSTTSESRVSSYLARQSFAPNPTVTESDKLSKRGFTSGYRLEKKQFSIPSKNMDLKIRTKSPLNAGFTKNVPCQVVRSNLTFANKYKFVRPHSVPCDPVVQKTSIKSSPGSFRRKHGELPTQIEKYKLVRASQKKVDSMLKPGLLSSTEKLTGTGAEFAQQKFNSGIKHVKPWSNQSKYKLVKQAVVGGDALNCNRADTILSDKSAKNSLSISLFPNVPVSDCSSISSTPANKTIVAPAVGQFPSIISAERKKVKSSNRSAVVSNKYKLIRRRRLSITNPDVHVAEIYTTVPAAAGSTSKLNKNQIKFAQCKYKLNRRWSPVVGAEQESIAEKVKASQTGEKTSQTEEKAAKRNINIVLSKYKLISRRSSGSGSCQSTSFTKLRKLWKKNSPGSASGSMRRHSVARMDSSYIVANQFKLIKRQKERNSLSRISTPLSSYSRPTKPQFKYCPSWSGGPKWKLGWTPTHSSFVSRFGSKKSSGNSLMSEFNGRQMNNFSRNKYKFFNSKLDSRKQRYPKKSQLKIDHRRLSARLKGKTPSAVNKRFSLRRSEVGMCCSNLQCFVAMCRNYTCDCNHNWRSRRVSGSFVVEGCSPLQAVATRIVHRSVHKLVMSRANRNRRNSVTLRRYCMFYNRFGRCTRGDKCTFIHDPDKVSVCTRYLRGTCKVDNCPFSHLVAPHKMPVCQYFLRGVCSHDNCPYLHVKVSKNAEPCLDFARGYCRLGDMCKKLHVFECPHFKATGSCPRGPRCPLRHPKKRSSVKLVQLDKSHSRPSAQVATFDIDKACSKHPLSASEIKFTEDNDDTSLPMKHRRLPSYISLTTSDPSLSAVAVEQVEKKEMLTRKAAASEFNGEDEVATQTWLLSSSSG